MISSPIEEIKNRLDIVEVISSYIKLQKTGANFRALCPFHSEKKPSFFVSPARQIWHCFGCGKGGNIFGFVKEIEGVEFGDALRILAQRAGVELKPMKPELRTERQRLYEICELSARFFEKQLEASKAGESVKKYLLERGINEESIKKWRLGWAPDTWQGLSDFLVSKEYQREEIEKAGLAIKKELSSFYDRFRGRIIFPIFDLNSQVIGFTARVFGEKAKEEVAKYVNTPNTLLYDKSRTLYGLDKAKLAIRKKDQCILVEGQTDVIMVSQAGFENVVATSGTALTPYQLKILKRYSENLLTAFDMDIAGDTATRRGIDLAQSQGFNVKVVRLPATKDPAEIISKNPKEWEKVLQEAKFILDFYFESAFSGRNPKEPEGKKEISKILLPVLKRIPNRIEQSHWIQRLANFLEVREEAIASELEKIKIESPDCLFAISEEEPRLPQKSRKELLEERLVTLGLKSQSSIDTLSQEDFDFFSPRISQILWHFKSKTKIPADLLDLFNYFSLKAEVETEENNIEKEFENCLKEIKFLGIKNKLDKISLEIKKAEQEKNLKKIEKLTQEFNQLTKDYQR